MPRQVVRNPIRVGLLLFKGQRGPVLQIQANSYRSTVWWPFHRHLPFSSLAFGKNPPREVSSTSSPLLPFPGHSTPLATLRPSSPRPSPSTELLPLIEAAGEYGPQLVRKPFSLKELKQIKADLGSYSNTTDKYIDAFQHLTSAYELS